jgi:hypothetical protein
MEDVCIRKLAFLAAHLQHELTTFSCDYKGIIKFHQTSKQPHTLILVLALLDPARVQLSLYPSLGLVAISLCPFGHIGVRNEVLEDELLWCPYP